jgi:hypothetical protein
MIEQRNDEISAYAMGWATCKGGPSRADWIPATDDDEETRREWVKGYAAALADIDPWGEQVSIEAALKSDGLSGAALEALLIAGETLERGEGWGDNFTRWPAAAVRHSAAALDERDRRILKNKGLWDEE